MYGVAQNRPCEVGLRISCREFVSFWCGTIDFNLFYQAANERFMAAKSSEGAMSERDQVLKDLAAAYDAYTELASNLAEGSKVYSHYFSIMLFCNGA